MNLATSFPPSRHAPRCSLLAWGLAAAFIAQPAAAQTQARSSLESSTLRPGDLGQTLSDFSRASGLQVVADPNLVRGKRSPGGSITGDKLKVMTALLRGTGLKPELDGDTIIVLQDDGAGADQGQAVDGAMHRKAVELDQVVVTGTAVEQPKFLAPYAVSTIDAAEIGRKVPHSVADMLRSVPGISAENSGGEAGGENVVIRGLPWAGFRLLDVLEDGLPLFESNYERQLQIDEVYRVDLGTTRAEIVRGGTAPIYSNNASGGVLNFITNHGTPTPQGSLKYSAGTGELNRLDGMASGPVNGNDGLLYAISGFYRRSDGLRNPGFSGGNDGGQIKLGGTYKFDSGKIWADLKYLNDRGVFYSAIPLTNPDTGASLGGLIDSNTGTLDSDSFRRVSIRTLDGKGGSGMVHRDLADGVHPEVRTLTFGADTELASGWRLSDKARYVSGDVGFDAILNGAPSNAADMLGSRLASASAALPGTRSLRYVLAGTNTPYDPATTDGLAMINTWSTTRTHYTELVNDLRLGRLFDTEHAGSHDLSLGISLNRFQLRQQQLSNALLTNVKSNPDALDIQALDASGQILGTLTENGFTDYGTGSLIGDSHGLSTAVYAADTWQVNDDLELDAGIRRVWRREEGNRGVIGTQTLSDTGPVAARTVTGLTGSVPYTRNQSGTSWTLGGSYRIADPLNVFARYTDTFSFPRLSEQWVSVVNGVGGRLPDGTATPVTPIRQAEVGAKYASRSLDVTLIGFYSDFKDLNASTYVSNADGLLVNQALILDTRTKGLELEGSWRPGGGFQLQASVTVQDPRYSGARTFSSLSASAVVDNEIARVPKLTWTLQPSYSFDLAGMQGNVYATWFGIDRRFQDVTDTSVLPAYHTVDLGLQLRINARLSLQLLGTNLTDSDGLTEGNARAPSVTGELERANASVGRPIFGRAYTASLQWDW